MSRWTMHLAMRGETVAMRSGYQPNYLGKDEWGESVVIQLVRINRQSLAYRLDGGAPSSRPLSANQAGAWVAV